MNWSVVVFCYNEARNIEPLYRKLHAVLTDIAPHEHEIIFVNDGSKDDTQGVLQKIAAADANVKVFTHPRNLGIGQALLTGYRATRNAWVTALPGDGQFDPDTLRMALPELKVGNFVSFYRVVQQGYTPFRKILSRVNKLLNQQVVGINLRDVNWVKVYPGDGLRNLDLHLQSSLVETEICAKLIRRGFKCVELPSEYRPRIFGEAKGASWPILLRAARETAKLVVAVRRA